MSFDLSQDLWVRGWGQRYQHADRNGQSLTGLSNALLVRGEGGKTVVDGGKGGKLEFAKGLHNPLNCPAEGGERYSNGPRHHLDIQYEQGKHKTSVHLSA